MQDGFESSGCEVALITETGGEIVWGSSGTSSAGAAAATLASAASRAQAAPSSVDAATASGSRDPPGGLEPDDYLFDPKAAYAWYESWRDADDDSSISSGEIPWLDNYDDLDYQAEWAQVGHIHTDSSALPVPCK